MNITAYNERCQILANLASEAIRLEGLDTKTASELESIRRGILANHYRITLLGSYQGGKSTIFNTACGGGRELSPTGIGMRTSAVPAEAHAIEEGEKEHAIVTWKTNQELLACFIEAIGPELRDLNRERLKNASDTEIIELIELGKVSDLKLLQRSVEKARSHLARDSKEFGTSSSSRGELLRIGTLILRHHEDFTLALGASSRHQTKVSIDEATRIVKFPEGWSRGEDAPSYGWHELRFLFARSVAFHVVSPDLSKLKAVLVDCPGLHASRWDNEIVHECIEQSDAIIWLQGDQGRELGLAEIEEARRFADYGITSEGIFLAFNAKGVSKLTAERILDSNLAKMREMAGLDVPGDRVAIFNALLALRAKQAQAVVRGNLVPETIEALSDKVRKQVEPEVLPEGGKNREANAKFLLKRDIRRQAAGFRDYEVDDPWDDGELAKLLEMSCWEQVIGQATQFIVDTKGRTRLIKRGAQPILDAIASFEECLKSAQKQVNMTLDDHMKSKAEAEKALKDFGHKVDGLLLPYERDINETAQAESGIGAGIRGELLVRFVSKRAKTSLRAAMESAIDEANQERDVRDAVRSAAVEWMRAIIAGWHVDARAGKSPAIRDYQRGKITALESTMKEFMLDAIGRSKGLLAQVRFDTPEIQEQDLIGYQASPMKRFKANFDWILDHTDKLSLLRPLRDGYEKVRKWITGAPFSRDAWKDRLNEYIKSLDEIIADKVVEHVTRDFLSVYFKAIANQIKAGKRQMRGEFESRIASIESDLAKTQEERAELAKRAKEIRQNVIKPFRERIERFIEETEAALPSGDLGSA